MGCDIHDYLEVRKDENSPWEKVGKIFDNPYYSPGRESKVDEDGYEWNPRKIDHPFDSRNYHLFAVLADVRNGRGFGGVEIGSRITPIADPKGLPDDVSDEIRKLSDEWGVDGHSHTWLTVRELAEYDWDAPHMQTGVVSIEDYEKLLEGKEPDGWSGSISGPKIVTISEDQYKAFKETGELPRIVDKSAFPGIFPDRVEFEGGVPGPDVQIYVQARWKSPGGVRHAVGERAMNVVAGLTDGYDWDNTRLVCWFDN